MKIQLIAAGVLTAALMGGLPGSGVAASAADADAAIAAAEEARAKAASVDSEWRDTAKMIKKAKALTESGDIDGAIKLADQAKRQGENGYAQGVAEKDAGFPDYVK